MPQIIFITGCVHPPGPQGHTEVGVSYAVDLDPVRTRYNQWYAYAQLRAMLNRHYKGVLYRVSQLRECPPIKTV